MIYRDFREKNNFSFLNKNSFFSIFRKKWKKKIEKLKNQKKIFKKNFDNSFFNRDFSHTKTIFSQKMNCQIIFLIFFFSFFVFRFFWGWYGVWNRNSTIRLRIPPQKKKYWKNYLTIHFLGKYSLCMWEVTVKKWFVKYFF